MSNFEHTASSFFTKLPAKRAFHRGDPTTDSPTVLCVRRTFHKCSSLWIPCWLRLSETDAQMELPEIPVGSMTSNPKLRDNQAQESELKKEIPIDR